MLRKSLFLLVNKRVYTTWQIFLPRQCSLFHMSLVVSLVTGIMLGLVRVLVEKWLIQLNGIINADEPIVLDYTSSLRVSASIDFLCADAYRMS